MLERERFALVGLEDRNGASEDADLRRIEQVCGSCAREVRLTVRWKSLYLALGEVLGLRSAAAMENLVSNSLAES